MMKTNKQLDDTAIFRVEKAIREQARRIAQELNLSESAFLRQGLMNLLKQHPIRKSDEKLRRQFIGT